MKHGLLRRICILATLLVALSLAAFAAEGADAHTNETYYVVLSDYACDVDRNDAADNYRVDYRVVLYDLFDLGTLQQVESVAFVEDTVPDAKRHTTYMPGDVLHFSADGVLEKVSLSAAQAALRLADDENALEVDIDSIDFIDSDTIGVDLVGRNGEKQTVSTLTPTQVHVKVVTLDICGLDEQDYALDNAIVMRPLPTDATDGRTLGELFAGNARMQEFGDFNAATEAESYFRYFFGSEGIAEITAPTAGVFDNFIARMAAEHAQLLIPDFDEMYEDYKSLAEMRNKAFYTVESVRVSAYASYHADKGTLDMVVFKLGPTQHIHSFVVLSETPATVFKTGKQKLACSSCGAVEMRILSKITGGNGYGNCTFTVSDSKGGDMIADATLIFKTTAQGIGVAHTRADGKVVQTLPYGTHEVTLTADGYAAKTVAVTVGSDCAFAYRLDLLSPEHAVQGMITEYIEADGSADVAKVRFDGTYKNKAGEWASMHIELAAADLGITEDTPKVGYLGMPTTIYTDCEPADFERKYDAIAADSDACVTQYAFETYIPVENLGDAGNILWDEQRQILTLGGEKFSAQNFEFRLYTFTSSMGGGWVRRDFSAFADNFLYTDYNGYYGSSANTYGRVLYCVVRDENTQKDVVCIYYTPYAFAQYFSRTLIYQPTGKETDFVTLGIYSATAEKNFDKTETHFVEYMLGTGYKVTPRLKSVTMKGGRTAKEVRLAGESVRSGEFMFYDYNALDNILTVAQVGSGMLEGRFTSYNALRETVKIDGVTKALAFKGSYAIEGQFPDSQRSLFANYSDSLRQYIDSLEAGRNNVRYVEMDGNVVYMDAVPPRVYNEHNSFDFVIATTDPERMANLLQISVAEYQSRLTEGIYIDDRGCAAAAVLNTETGKWKLAAVKNFWYGDYDVDEAAFEKKLDLGETAKYYDMIGESYNKAADYKACRDALNSSAVFFVVGAQNGVYDLAAVSGYNRGDMTTPTLVAGENQIGLVFADGNAKTNKIQATNDEDDAARVTLHCETVIVVVNGNRVSVRVGRRKAAESITLTSGSAYFLAASDSLIVMDITGATLREPYVLDAYWTGDVESAGHDFVTVEEAVEPTYNAPGRTASKRCTRCGITVGGEEIPQRSARPGDVNGDDAVSKLDLLRLQKHLAGWKVEIVWTAADTNGDGAVNKADLLRLQKYLAGWDVPLGK